MSLRIVDLTSPFIDSAAALLHETLLNRTEDWQDLPSARMEVVESLQADKISRVATEESGTVLGWIGGFPSYDGHVWEIHPLVVAASERRRGLGRALVEDLESLVRVRGALTLVAASDDENDETTLSGADLYRDVPGAIRNVKNLRGHPYEFYLRLGFTIVGLMPDANGRGKPDIFLAKRVG